MVKEILSYLKNPAYEEDTSHDLTYKFRYLVSVVLICLCVSICLLLVAGILESVFKLELGKHAMDDLLDNYPPIVIFALAVILAPLLEELFFRGPLIWFKNSNYFRYIFYFMALLFGYVHITNFEVTPVVLALSPLLVAPQFFVGLLAGMIRVKFGLLWSIFLHGLYNFILVTPILVLKLLDIPLE